MRTRLLIALGLALVLALGIAMAANAVSGAAFTTFNPWVDGLFKDVCKNSIINCNLYGAKPDVWLNGGPAANGLGPDGQYFFAVLVPGGQPDPNDGGVKNLSDDYDAYTNRTFTVTEGEVSDYGGTHDLDSGNFLDPNRPYCHNKRGCEPDGEPPLIRLYPYADTWNPGGVYILAICYIGDGSEYPVEPRDCKYDAFKVKEVFTAVLRLSGIKFEDMFADGKADWVFWVYEDPGLEGWQITIDGTGFLGEPIHEIVETNADGFWEFQKDYSYNKFTPLVPAELTVCEILEPGWVQSYPDPVCYDLTIEPASLAEVNDLDFGNWYPVDVKACKVRDLDGDLATTGDQSLIAGWPVSLTEGEVVVDEQQTGADGCYTWTELEPGIVYDVHEGTKPGWVALGATDYVFDKAQSGDSFSHTFFNRPTEGCTPGFWQGGPDKPDAKAGGALLWDGDDMMPWGDQQDPPPHVDAQWIASGGSNPPGNPYIHITLFNDFFAPNAGLDGFDMFALVGTGGGSDDYQKAARDLVAAYLNASWGMGYAYTPAELEQMWADTVATGDFLALHLLLDAANNAPNGCPISASGY